MENSIQTLINTLKHRSILCLYTLNLPLLTKSLPGRIDNASTWLFDPLKLILNIRKGETYKEGGYTHKESLTNQLVKHTKNRYLYSFVYISRIQLGCMRDILVYPHIEVITLQSPYYGSIYNWK
jgi:hypothetical protein